MPGYVIDATPIAVDFWRPTKAPQARLFFLTHLHADHIEGLTSSWRLPIHTSPITALLLKKKFKLPDSVIRELEVGQSYLIPLGDGGNSTITVSVIDANHVPGSVMFLFQGYFGNILYCGDMRWYPEVLEEPVLRDVVQQNALDILYLDNTYSAPYCLFPSREEAKQQIFEIIDAYPDHEIKIGINNLGREKLLEEIAHRYGERILVSQEKYEQLQLLGCVDVFTTDPELSRIHTVPMKQIQVTTHRKWNDKYQTISIIPSALFVGWKNGPFTSQTSNGMHVVPYSDHSSYLELMEMVSLLAPHQIFPIVKYWSKFGWWADPSAPDQDLKADMTVYRRLLSLPPPDPIVIPEDVIKMMNTKTPRILQTQPRRCILRRGLSPRRSKFRGIMFTSPGSHSLPSIPYTPLGTPTSLTTLESNRSDILSPRRTSCMESPKSLRQGVQCARNPNDLPEAIKNYMHYSHVLDGVVLENNASRPSSGPHEAVRIEIEQSQPTRHASSARDYVSNEDNVDGKHQPEMPIETTKRALFTKKSEAAQFNPVRIDLKRKSKSQNISMRRDVVLKKLNDFIEHRNEEMNYHHISNVEEELCVMTQDTKVILESLSYLSSLM